MSQRRLRGYDPKRREDERDDCFVSALSTACRIPYDVAHAVCASAGRAPRKGTSAYTRWKILNAEVTEGNVREVPPHRLFHPYDPDARGGRGEMRQLTLREWLKGDGARGRFIVCTRDHAVAVTDGVVHDTKPAYKARVYEAWEILKGARRRRRRT